MLLAVDEVDGTQAEIEELIVLCGALTLVQTHEIKEEDRLSASYERWYAGRSGANVLRWNLLGSGWPFRSHG